MDTCRWRGRHPWSRLAVFAFMIVGLAGSSAYADEGGHYGG